MKNTLAPSQSLAERLRHRIRVDGPITFRDWMDAALYDELEGYYLRPDRVRWGREGDYRTSPERSVLFGATFARYFADLFRESGSPSALTIVEVGGGAGHFAHAVLETLERRYPETYHATTYVFDETSLHSRSLAKERLSRFGDRVLFRRLSELPAISLGIIFANELLDAFPVHRVVMNDGKLHEFFVRLDDSGRFQWSLGPLSTDRIAKFLEHLKIQLGEQQTAEVNLALKDWFQEVSEKLMSGYLISVDYGAEASELYGSTALREGSLRAFQQHGFAGLLDHPGEQDITSTVDWTTARRIGSELGLEPIEFERQDRFLLKAGILKELELRNSEARNENEKTRLRASAREMILPNGMAASFQVLVQQRAGGGASKPPPINFQ